MRYIKNITFEKMHWILSLSLRLTIVLAILAAIVNARWMIVFVAGLTLSLTFLPALLKRQYNVTLTTELETLIIIFIYASLFLGEIHDYYTKYWWWDIVLHTGSGLALGLVGFLLMYILYNEQKVSASPILIALLSFSFAMACGAIWEIFEFSIDSFFGTIMQRNSLNDTMWDLIIDASGSILSATAGYFYILHGKAPLFSDIVNRFMENNPKLFKSEKESK